MGLYYRADVEHRRRGREEGLVGQKAAMGGAIKNHGLPRKPLARELREISAIDERVVRNLR